MRRSHKLRSVPASDDNQLPLGRFVEGHVVAVHSDDKVLFRSECGVQAELRLPRHVEKGWLKAAVDLAPVPAIAFHPEELDRPLLWGVFSTAEHEALDERFQIKAKTIELDASESVRVRTGRSIVTVTSAGDIQVRGRNVTSRASNVNRIRGGAVRIN